MTVGLWFDWSGTGFGNNAHDDCTSLLMAASRQAGGAPDITGSASPGTAVFTLQNPDGLFDPDNASGPLYGLLADGVRVWWGANEDGSISGAGTVRGRFAGRITDLSPVPAAGAGTSTPTVEIVCADALDWYGRADVALTVERLSGGGATLSRVTGGAQFTSVTGYGSVNGVTGLSGVQAGDLVVITCGWGGGGFGVNPIPDPLIMPNASFAELTRHDADFSAGSGLGGRTTQHWGFAAGGETSFGIGSSYSGILNGTWAIVDVFRGLGTSVTAVGAVGTAVGATGTVPAVTPPAGRKAVVYVGNAIAPNYTAVPSAGWTTDATFNGGSRQAGTSAHQFTAAAPGTAYNGTWTGVGAETGWVFHSAAFYATPASASVWKSQHDIRQALLDDAGETGRYALDEEQPMLLTWLCEGLLLDLLTSLNSANGTRHFVAASDSRDSWYSYTTRNRQWKLTAAADAAINGAGGTGYAVTGIDGWRVTADGVVNRQAATVAEPSEPNAPETVWTYDLLPPLPLTIVSGKPLALRASFTDYVLPDASLVVTSTGSALTKTLDLHGQTADITLASAGTTVVTALSVLGRLVVRAASATYTANDTASQSAAARGVRAGPEIGGDLAGPLDTARGLADHVVWRYAGRQIRPTVTLANWLPYAFRVGLFDVVSVTSAQLRATGRLYEVVGLTERCDRAVAGGPVYWTTSLTLQERRLQTGDATSFFTLGTSALTTGSDVLAY